jgi:hypothetical protein
VNSFTGTWKPDGTFTYKGKGSSVTGTVKAGTYLEATFLCPDPKDGGGTQKGTFQYAMTPAKMDKAAAEAKDRFAKEQADHEAREFKKAVQVAACLGCSIS